MSPHAIIAENLVNLLSEKNFVDCIMSILTIFKCIHENFCHDIGIYTPAPLSSTGHSPIHRMVVTDSANYGRKVLIKLTIHKSYIHNIITICRCYI